MFFFKRKSSTYFNVILEAIECERWPSTHCEQTFCSCLWLSVHFHCFWDIVTCYIVRPRMFSVGLAHTFGVVTVLFTGAFLRLTTVWVGTCVCLLRVINFAVDFVILRTKVHFSEWCITVVVLFNVCFHSILLTKINFDNKFYLLDLEFKIPCIIGSCSEKWTTLEN